MTPLRKTLLKSIEEAGKLTPPSRLCQLLIGAAPECRLINISDKLLQEGLAHYIKLFTDSPLEQNFDNWDFDIRNQLLEELAKYSDEKPEWSLGYTLVNFAGWANISRPWLTYDIEDEDLLRGARNPQDSVVRPDPINWPNYSVDDLTN